MPITTTSFTSVNVGTSANDGTGDELRNAFIKVNSNFSNISTVGFNSGNILASGNVEAVYFVGDGSQLTNISASNAYGNANVAAYLVAYNGIVSASNVFVAGNVTSQWFVGQANLSSIITTDLGASGMIYANAGVNSTSTGTGALVVNGGVGITGNLTVGNLTVLGTQTVVNATSVAVANSFIFLSNNNITNVLDIGFVGQYAAGQGNVYTGLVRRASDGIYRLFSNLDPIPSTTINVANITLATLQLGNILAGNITGVINTPAQPYITSLGNLASLSSSGNITTTGYFFGNGSQLAGVVSYSNVFVATYLPTYSGNIANLTVATTLAGPTITAINSNISVGNTNMKNYVDGQITAANSAVTAANLGLKGYVDNSVSTANIGMKGYVDAVASLSIYGDSNVKSYLTQFDGNLISNGNIAYNIGTAVNQWATVYANVVSAAYFTGNGALLTGIPAGYSNVQAATYLPTYSGNIANIRLGVSGVLTFADGTAMTTASGGGGSNYSNVNVKAYTESMGYQNFGNVNVAAYVTSANSAILGYIDLANTIQSGQVGAANLAITAANLGMKGYVDSVASQSIYGNANVASYLPTYSGNIANVRLGVSGVLTFPDGTTQTTAASGGGSNYGNANVTAYTVSMGFTNYSNVNVSALITTNGLTNYSNVNAKAYAETMGYQNFGNVNVAAYVTTANSAVIGYVDNKVSTANIGVIGYIDRGNTIVTAGITTANVGMKGYVDAGIIWSISASGSADYVFSGPGIVAGNTNDPVLYLYKGLSYTFINTTGGSHPFAIRVSNGGADYTSGVSGSQTGTQLFTVPMDAPSTLYYQCTIHGGMGNTIYVISLDQNFGNVNVKAYSETMGYQNFGNVNVAAYLGTGQITAANVKLAPSGNIQFADGTSQTSAYSNVNLIANLRGSITVGNITILGALNTTLNIGNSFIGLATDNTSNTNDIGFYGQYNVGQGNVFTGLAYTAADGMYRLFSNVTPEPGTTINQANVRYSNIQVGNILAANITVNTVVASNVYVNGNVLANYSTLTSLNATGNISATGLSVFGNTAHGLAGAVSGQLHSFVGNITQISSGGAVSINTTGNILANVATFGSGNVGGFAIGYRDVPQITAANVTLIASDAGKHYYGSNTNPVTLTIPLNSSVAFGNGTAISLVNQGTGNITITPTAGALLYLAGNTTSGSKTLTSYGMATLLKVQVNTWFINGTGLV